MFVIRDVAPEDFEQLHALARVLNTVNLPDNEAALRDVLDVGVRSFSGEITEPLDREYLFVMEDTETGRLVGTSMIIARHGSKDAPHAFLQVGVEERYSRSVDAHFRHQTLRVGYDYDGPTEIGGLVLSPDFRGHKMKLGKQLSFVRFLFVGMHRDRFRNRVLAELLPPFDDNGRSALWEALGKRFTGLDYHEADLISKTNKAFIRDLFPTDIVYTTLFSKKAQAVIGEVGPATQGVKKMLTDIGFRYVERIDPFDGGPHYEAETESLWPVAQTKAHHVAIGDDERIATRQGESVEGLVAVHDESGSAGSIFRCTWAHYAAEEKDIVLGESARKCLGVDEGTKVSALAFVEHRRR